VGLQGTEFEGKPMSHAVAERSESDWTHAWSDGKTFSAVGGAENLGEVLDHFRAFVDARKSSGDSGSQDSDQR
jgi:hypothetical protein